MSPSLYGTEFGLTSFEGDKLRTTVLELDLDTVYGGFRHTERRLEHVTLKMK